MVQFNSGPVGDSSARSWGVSCMETQQGFDFRRFGMNKAVVRKIVDEQNVKAGFVPDLTATAESAQQLILALGIKPEDNLFSFGIIAARDEE